MKPKPPYPVRAGWDGFFCHIHQIIRGLGKKRRQPRDRRCKWTAAFIGVGGKYEGKRGRNPTPLPFIDCYWPCLDRRIKSYTFIGLSVDSSYKSPCFTWSIYNTPSK